MKKRKRGHSWDKKTTTTTTKTKERKKRRRDDYFSGSWKPDTARYMHGCQEMISWDCGLPTFLTLLMVFRLLDQCLLTTRFVPLCWFPLYARGFCWPHFALLSVSWAASPAHLLCTSWGWVASPRCVGDVEGSHSTEVWTARKLVLVLSGPSN